MSLILFFGWCEHAQCNGHLLCLWFCSLGDVSMHSVMATCCVFDFVLWVMWACTHPLLPITKRWCVQQGWVGIFFTVCSQSCKLLLMMLRSETDCNINEAFWNKMLGLKCSFSLIHFAQNVLPWNPPKQLYKKKWAEKQSNVLMWVL